MAKAAAASGGQADNRIHWAGESHARKTFKKQKDFMMDWCNVLYRA